MSVNSNTAQHTPMGQRRFGRVNWLGMMTLYGKEVRRFFKVYMQTLVAPVATAGLFMAVFTLALAACGVFGSRYRDDGGDPKRFRQFIVVFGCGQGARQHC